MTVETLYAEVSSEEVVKTYFNMVYKLALSQTKNRDLADDAVQEVFLRYIQQKNDTFQSEEHRKAWLIRVTVNCCKSILTCSWYKKTVPLEDDLPFQNQEEGDVYYAVLDLPLKYRTVIHLFYYEDLSVAEIAQTLHIKESTIKSQLHRGRELLKTKLKGGYEFV